MPKDVSCYVTREYTKREERKAKRQHFEHKRNGNEIIVILWTTSPKEQRKSSLYKKKGDRIDVTGGTQLGQLTAPSSKNKTLLAER